MWLEFRRVLFRSPLSNSMLTTEENIQLALNEGGNLVTKEVLSNFDTDGSPIVIGNDKYTSKGAVPKNYQTPYGEANVEDRKSVV